MRKPQISKNTLYGCKKTNAVEQKVILYAENKISDGWSILIDTIVDIHCDLFRDMDFM